VSAVQPLYLDIFLEPLADVLAQPDVTDVYVNRAGELWLERLGGAIERHARPELTEALLWRLARQVASFAHQGISREHPLLAARLPDGTRIQVVAPPATRDGVAIALRRHVVANLSLAEYEDAGAFRTVRSAAEPARAETELRALHDGGKWSQFLAAAVRARKTILVSGGTSSGKTTFLNALLAEIPGDERLIFIEDTPEVSITHENAFGMVAVRGRLGEAEVSTDDLLLASLRMRPDRIILGEVRGSEAFTLLRAANSGHPGSMTTIHADDPSVALEQLALLATSAQRLRRDDVLSFASRAIDIVVQLERKSGVRSIAEIRWRGVND